MGRFREMFLLSLDTKFASLGRTSEYLVASEMSSKVRPVGLVCSKKCSAGRKISLSMLGYFISYGHICYMSEFTSVLKDN